MAKISDFVTISITKQTNVVSQTGFGTLLVVGDSDVLPKAEEVLLTNSAALVTGNVYAAKLNGIALTGAGLTFATDNNTTMNAIATIIRNRAEVQDVIAKDVGAVGYFNTLQVIGETDEVLNFTEVVVSGGASQPTVTVEKDIALERTRSYTSLAGVSADFAATDQEYLAAEKAFSQNPRPTTVKIGRLNPSGETYVEALNEIILADDDWYGLTIISRIGADVQAVAAWAETKLKLFITAKDDGGILTSGTGDIAYYLKNLDYERSAAFYNESADGSVTDEFPDAAWFGRMLPKKPGAATWAFKSLTGVSPSVLTDTQRGYALGKNCNMYESVANNPMTYPGMVASGEYLDVVIGCDWLQSRIAERVFGRLINTDKIPYTDAGIAMIVGELRAQLEEAVDNGVINADYTIDYPAAADISAAQKATRELVDIEFIATLQGAVHSVTINGTVSY